MDARISDVVVTLDKRWEDKLDEAVDMLKKVGMEVSCADDDNSVVEGTIDVCKVHELQKLDAVDYVRTVFTYDAEYPPGDPRDTNGI
jgi:hypothetical protein